VNPAGERTVHVLYDRECGFCRWSVAVLLRLDSRGMLDPVAIQSPEGQRLLAPLAEELRLASAHAVDASGNVRSGGDAAPLIATSLRGGGALSALAGASPPLTRAAYRFTAGNRTRLGRLVSPARRTAADRTLAERTRPGCG